MRSAKTPPVEVGQSLTATPSEMMRVYSSASDNDNDERQSGSYFNLLSERPIVGRFHDVEDHRRAAAAKQRAEALERGVTDSHRLFLDKKRKQRTAKQYAARDAARGRR